MVFNCLRHAAVAAGSGVNNCYVMVQVGGAVGRIASVIPPFFSYFRVEGMFLGTKNVVH